MSKERDYRAFWVCYMKYYAVTLLNLNSKENYTQLSDRIMNGTDHQMLLAATIGIQDANIPDNVLLSYTEFVEKFDETICD